MHSFYKQEITNMLKNPLHNLQPSRIFAILKKKFLENQYDKSVPFPTLEQIQNFKRRLNRTEHISIGNNCVLFSDLTESMAFPDLNKDVPHADGKKPIGRPKK